MLKDEYRVYNYGLSAVCVKLPNYEMIFRNASLEEPYMEVLTLRDIEYVNANSGVFRDGLLQFDDADQDELYKHLHIANWRESVLFESQIDEILLHPTQEGLQRILNVRTPIMIDRFRGHLVKLSQDPRYDVSTRVEKIVEDRFEEIRNGVFRSAIVLSMPAEVRSAVEIENDTLKVQLKQLMAQMADMQQQMAVAKVASETVTKPVNKPGRKPAAKKSE